MNNTGLILDAVSINDLNELAVKAEKPNFYSIWSTEFCRTTFQQISTPASVTSNILLGTAISLDIDEISNKRFILGLGSGPKYTNEKYHCASYGKPVKRIRECIELNKNYT